MTSGRMPERTKVARSHAHLTDIYDRLEHWRKTALLAAVIKRFVEIDGATSSAVVAIQLFTVVIPLVIIGFAYFSGFVSNASVGDLFIRDLGLHHPLDDHVREAFGAASDLRSVWTFVGLGAFLIWGIPMAIKVAAIFGHAWRRRQFGMPEQLARGTTWFVLYLVTMAAHERIAFAGNHGAGIRTALVTVSLVPVWIFWSLTPALLVRDGARGWKYYALAGFSGVLIDGVVLSAVVRLGFPVLLGGWTGFGPIGVAMTLMTWCGVLATGWVVIACVSAVVWERNSPPETVVE